MPRPFGLVDDAARAKYFSIYRCNLADAVATDFHVKTCLVWKPRVLSYLYVAKIPYDRKFKELTRAPGWTHML
jgi:hypothetical protein